MRMAEGRVPEPTKGGQTIVDAIHAPAVVYITNPGAGANNLPVIGILKPGVNAVDRKLYEAGKKSIPWDQLPGYSVRDPAKKQGPKDMSADEAVAFAIDTNDVGILESFRRTEKRNSVVSAIDHQLKCLDLAGLPIPEVMSGCNLLC